MSVRKLLWPVVALLFLALLPGCNNAPPPPEHFPEIGWTMLPPIKLNVARVEVVKQYVPIQVPPHIEADVPRTLLDSADLWARERLQPVANGGYARFVITDASVVMVSLPVKKGIDQTFNNQNSRRMDAHIVVRLEVHGADGSSSGEITAEASASRTLRQEDDQREISEQQYLLVSDAMTALNRVLDQNIHTYLVQFVVP